MMGHPRELDKSLMMSLMNCAWIRDHLNAIITGPAGAGQLHASHWHETLSNPTLADTILDRLVHNVYKINLKGDSMIKRKSRLT